MKYGGYLKAGAKVARDIKAGFQGPRIQVSKDPKEKGPRIPGVKDSSEIKFKNRKIGFCASVISATRRGDRIRLCAERGQV